MPLTAITAVKILIKTGATVLFNQFVEDPFARGLMSNVTSEVVGATMKEKKSEAAFVSFEEMILDIIRESIGECGITENEKIETCEKEVFYFVNKVKIPGEAFLSERLGEYLWEQYQQQLETPSDEIYKGIFLHYAPKYFELFCKKEQVPITVAKLLNQAISVLQNDVEMHSQEIEQIKSNIADLQKQYPITREDILGEYYKGQKLHFESPNKGVNKAIIGEESLEASYIEPLTEIEGNLVPLLDVVEGWVDESESGVLLLHGEPGHGKTTFCMKAVCEFANGHRFKKAAQVLQFPLKNWKIDDITGEDYNIDSIFKDKACGSQPVIQTMNAKNAVIFLDAFDEVKQVLQNKGIEQYQQLADYLMEVAEGKGIHFIVTSRTNAVKEVDENSYEFAPLTIKQQKEWCLARADYKERWELYYEGICKNQDEKTDDLKALMGTPFVFRMVIHTNYQMSGEINNRAKLYEDIFSYFLTKKGLKTKGHVLTSAYQDLAYRIWCRDEDTTTINEEILKDGKYVNKSDYLLLFFFMKEDRSKAEQTIGFMHRSFYQYFLARYFFSQLKECKDENKAEDFLKKLGERRIDNEIFRLFKQIRNNEEHGDLTDQAKTLLSTLEKHEGIILTKPVDTEGDVTRIQFDRCNNVYCNALSMSFYFPITAFFNDMDNLRQLVGRYDCSGIRLYSDRDEERTKLDDVRLKMGKLSRTNLNGVNMNGAYLEGAHLRAAALNGAYMEKADLTAAHMEIALLNGANMNRANLNGAYLFETYLIGAHMEKTHMYGAHLSGAHLDGSYLIAAHLDGAYLKGAHLNEAYLNEARLNEAYLEGARLNEAHLDGAYLRGADLVGAELNGADLQGADLRRADLDGAEVKGTKFSRASLIAAHMDISDLESRGAEIID